MHTTTHALISRHKLRLASVNPDLFFQHASGYETMHLPPPCFISLRKLLVSTHVVFDLTVVLYTRGTSAMRNVSTCHRTATHKRIDEAIHCTTLRQHRHSHAALHLIHICKPSW